MKKHRLEIPETIKTSDLKTMMERGVDRSYLERYDR